MTHNLNNNRQGTAPMGISRILCLSGVLIFSCGSFVKVQAQSMSQYSAVPPMSVREAGPSNIMLTLSLDHQLFFEAYNDYENLVGTPLPEITYTHDTTKAFTYTGYFASDVCYSYVDATPNGQTEKEGVFQPIRKADAQNYCTAGGWSGNFLNWLTMTRMDLVRYVLYGGYRSTDTATTTVLERAYLPQDAHSFAKYYKGNIENLTDGLAAHAAGYTFCNTSRPTVHNSSSGSKPSTFSHLGAERTTPPLLRAVPGDYSLWASNERFQCVTRDEMPGQDETATEEYMAYVNDYGFGTNGNVNPDVTGISASAIAPQTADVTDYVVRVSACTGVDDSDDRCLQYGDNKKPYGVLQINDADFRNFGLITGSYRSNKSYGALRKNLAPLSTEINDDGTFVARPIPEIIAAGNQTPAPSIIGSLNAARLTHYQYWHVDGNTSKEAREGLGTYNTNCDWGLGALKQNGDPPFANGECVNWGNPFSELLAESYRYFAGTNAASVDVSGEAGDLPGLSVDTWPTNQNSSEVAACSKNAVVAFNASAVSYDGDELSGSVTPASIGIGSSENTATIESLTNAIGTGEALTGNYFIGELLGTTSDEDGLCSAKSVGGKLASVRGTCPETPRLEGSYLGAGLAHFVHQNDINPNTEYLETVQTYGVTLAAELPKIKVTGNEREITIVPLCRNLGDDIGSDTDDVGNCALVDFRPIAVTESEGFYYIGWEDSEQGGDYDLDISGTLKYQIVGTNLLVDTHIIYESAGEALEFGFAVTGTKSQTSDGVYFPSHIIADQPGNNNTVNPREQIRIILDSNSSPEAVTQAKANLKTYSEVDADTATRWCKVLDDRCVNAVDSNTRIQRVTLSLATDDGVSAAKLLEPPLYFAAKWGSFDDDDNKSGTPDQEDEWMEDGSMLGYEEVSNPASLREKLTKTISKAGTLPTVATGTNEVSTSVTGEGIAMQTFYYPELEAEGSDLLWVGTMSALFIDANGNLREDTDLEGASVGNGRLDDGDKIVDFVYIQDTGKVEIHLYTYNTATGTGVADSLEIRPFEELDTLNYVWNVDLDSVTDYVTHRESLTSDLGSGRHIITAVDGVVEGDDPDSLIDVEEVITFDVASYGAALAPFIDAPAGVSSDDVINYIRGAAIKDNEDNDVFRKRTKGSKDYLLGDIVNSSPAIVGAPSDEYGRRKYGDASYEAFATAKRNRRSMAYVGANDGMLHAFDLGYYDATSKAYYANFIPSPQEGEGRFQNPINADSLGKEKWAYVPYNLLPHLKWLTDKNYSHVYYMDGPIQIFDVNIFANDTDHTGGWGTILVASMRFGGGEYNLDVAEGDSRTLRSAYVIFDITNPDSPQLLGEITHDNLGFTTSNTQIAVRRSLSNSSVNDWFLVFGSGPQGTDGLSKATSSQNAHIFYVDLKLLASGTANITAIDTGVANSFVGGVTAKDWDSDYYTNAIYFGLVGDGDSEKGRLMHAPVARTGDPLSENTVETLLTGVDAPFSAAPTVSTDTFQNCWVYAGTGRFWVTDDAKPSSEQNSIYGVNVKDGVVAANELLDITNFHVYKNDLDEFAVRARDAQGNLISRQEGDYDLTNVDTVSQYVREVKKGWVRHFPAEGEKNYLSPLVLNDTVFYATFNPGVGNVCEADGRSIFYAVDMFSGLPQTRLKTLSLVNNSGGVPGLDGYNEEVVPELGSTPGAITKVAEVSSKSLVAGDNKGGQSGFNPELGDPGTSRRGWREISTEDIK